MPAELGAVHSLRIDVPEEGCFLFVGFTAFVGAYGKRGYGTADQFLPWTISCGSTAAARVRSRARSADG
ncbi:hypothetical protein OG413_29215 [Streptomyces sp. NBC_01433]|uniref:hypothetical protein n=1 Tax=Streptomyces sp. NBC_01433 TaxID=2903864 RepID=UPI002253262F|nr:hypothetical protein [Streptomyces sp. NBC_01433]MCX4679321.1 hypothetical protein [Streptomyces sp. NBC_01433]